MLVSNASTLVLLAKIECLETFIELSPIIEIPAQVKNEVLFHEVSYYAKLINKLIQNEKIKVRSIDYDKIKEIMLEFRMDEGESATYVLFNKEKHKAILTDDRELIKLCKLENVPFICAMAVVIRLFEESKLSKEKAIEKLKKLNEVGRYSKELYEHFKKQIK